MAHLTNRYNGIDWRAIRIARADEKQRKKNAITRICAAACLARYKQDKEKDI